MNAFAAKPMPRILRVKVIAGDPARHEALTRLVREFGFVIAPAMGSADVVLTDGVLSSIPLPTVAIGEADGDHQANLPAHASPEQIDAALRAVAAGLVVSLAERGASKFDALEDSEDRLLLTPRETEVLAAVARGLTNKEIAMKLGISRHTVKFHLESLMRKLGASTRTEAVSKSIPLKLLEPYRV